MLTFCVRMFFHGFKGIVFLQCLTIVGIIHHYNIPRKIINICRSGCWSRDLYLIPGSSPIYRAINKVGICYNPPIIFICKSNIKQPPPVGIVNLLLQLSPRSIVIKSFPLFRSYPSFLDIGKIYGTGFIFCIKFVRIPDVSRNHM